MSPSHVVIHNFALLSSSGTPVRPIVFEPVGFQESRHLYSPCSTGQLADIFAK
jgi:hypothetical protein